VWSALPPALPVARREAKGVLEERCMVVVADDWEMSSRYVSQSINGTQRQPEEKKATELLLGACGCAFSSPIEPANQITCAATQ
jgi:hypothetical protein